MKRLATFFMLMFFASILTDPSMFMMNIERGKVYTEKFSLNHIIKPAYSSPAINSQNTLSNPGSCRFLFHRHFQLTRYAIPEKRAVLAGAKTHYVDIEFLPTYPAFSNSLTTINSKKQLDYSNRLKLPILFCCVTPGTHNGCNHA
jgi:hypothetical protein